MRIFWNRSGLHKGPPAKDCSSFRGVGLSERSATEITLFTLEDRRRAREIRLNESRPGREELKSLGNRAR